MEDRAQNFQRGKEVYAYTWRQNLGARAQYLGRGNTSAHHCFADEDLSADNDASGLKKATFLQALGRRDKNVEDLENAKQYMYAELFSMISEESKRKLSESTRWANIEKVQWTKYALSIKHQTREALSTTGYSRGEYTIG